MSQTQSWKPGTLTATDPAEIGHDWADLHVPTRAYLGDPRWGIRADLPTGVPARPAVMAPTGHMAPVAHAVLAAPSGPAVAAAPASPPIPSAPASVPPAFAPVQPAFAPVRPGAEAMLAGPAPALPLPVPPVFAPVRTKTPGWLIAVALLGVGTVLAGVAAAVAIPVFLNQRAKLATTTLRTDLTTVAAAEESVRAQTGSYSADPAAVSAHLRDDLTSQVAILWADGTGWCAQAVPVGATEPVLYASSASGVSTQSCG